MFETTGCSYVYLNYGVHWLFNVTCRPEGEPGAVLIRGARPIEGLDVIKRRRPKAENEGDLLSGPGKIGAALEATGEHTFTDLLKNGSYFRLVPNDPVKKILTGSRVGLRPGSDQREWRFVDEENRDWASSPRL